MASLLQDLKLSARQLSRRPVLTAMAVVTLGIGIGVNAVAFTVVNGILFKRPAVERADQVGRIETIPAAGDSGYASLPEYLRLADATRATLDIAAEGRVSLALRHGGTTRPAYALFVSSSYFHLVGARPMAGRVEVARGTGGPPSIVIGERFWRRTLGAPPLAGLTLRLNTVAVNVTGILPESFRGPAGLYSPDVWLPLDDVESFRTSPALQRRDERWLFVFGELRPGANAAAVQGAVGAAAAQMARDWPDTHRARSARFRLMSEPGGEIQGLQTAAVLAMSIIGLVLLLACFNVANLLLARAVERERDMAIRAAVGAGALRLVRLVITEGLLMAALAGIAAVVLASWAQSLLGSFAIPIDTPQYIDLSPDWTVIGFIGLLVLIAGALPGLWPALAAVRVDVVRVLGSHGSVAGGNRLPMRRWLVGAQIAGSTAFLALAAWLVQSYGAIGHVDTGFARDALIVAEVAPSSHGYDAAASERYIAAVAARVGALPGVAGVAIADHAPFFIGFDRMTPVAPLAAACEADDCPRVATYGVGPGYFSTMGIPLVAGREPGRGAPDEAVINSALAHLLYEDGDATGRTLRLLDEHRLVTVVGVAGPTRTRGLAREQPTLWLPIAARDFEHGLSLIVRTTVPPVTLVRAVEHAAQAVDANVAVAAVKTMAARMAVQLWPFRTVSWLFSICAVLALILSTVGLAGVIVHAVHRRRREFGVRLSLGATPRDLAADVLAGSARLLWPGLLIGLMSAAAGARLLRFALVGVDVVDPATYVAVIALEAAIVIAATLGPALRAARVDPVEALRAQ